MFWAAGGTDAHRRPSLQQLPAHKWRRVWTVTSGPVPQLVAGELVRSMPYMHAFTSAIRTRLSEEKADPQLGWARAVFSGHEGLAAMGGIA